MESHVVRCARYARISFDKAGDEHGVTNQLADQQRVADSRGFVIVRTEVDNDISALNGKHRPGYEAVMAAAARGEIDVILVFQTSRFWRNRRERAEGIEILRKAGVSLIATKGPSLDMSTAYGRGMAGLLGEFDTMESEVKAERQQLAAFHRAENGQPPAGVRLTGYTMAGVAVEDEAEVVRQMFARFHAGDSLRGIVAWLTGQGVPTRSGRPWNPSSVRTILTNSRYAGRVVYRGQSRVRQRQGGRVAAAGRGMAVRCGAGQAVRPAAPEAGRHRPQASRVWPVPVRHLWSACPLAHGIPARRTAATLSVPGRRACDPQRGTVDDLVLRPVRARLAKLISRACWPNRPARKPARRRMRSCGYAAGWSKPGWTTTMT